jgi:general secretion pathway protein H
MTSCPSERTGEKAVPALPPTSPTGHADLIVGDAGFTLLEVVCVLAILSIIAAVILPAMSQGTSRARLEGYALQIAGMLTADRHAAMRRRVPVVADIDVARRSVRSGATGRVLRLPADVTLDALLAARCNKRPAGSAIQFFASGMSCGGVVAVTRAGTGYQIRVNWLTGGVEIVPVNPS